MLTAEQIAAIAAKALEDKKKQLELSINSASPNVNHSPVPTKKKGFLR